MNNYVYIYYDTRLNPPVPIYVGKGTKNRWKQHLSSKTNILLFRKLQKIKQEGLEPIVVKFIDNVSEEEAFKIEIELIEKFGRLIDETGTLCNFTGGGTGGRLNFKHTEETKKLLSKQRKGKKQTEKQYLANCNRKASEETKRKMSEAQKGIDRISPEKREKMRLKRTGFKHTEETKKKLSITRKGKKQTEKQYLANCSRKPKTRKLECLNNNTVYESIKKASIELGMSENSISAVARGVRNHHKGFKFKYID